MSLPPSFNLMLERFNTIKAEIFICVQFIMQYIVNMNIKSHVKSHG
jgi:hypothetical protein